MGGTIEFYDPAYEDINKQLLRLDTSIESYFSHIIKPHFTFSTEAIAQKDSRDIDENDRQRLAKAIQVTEHRNVIVTHGTFTLSQTAKFIDTQDLGDKVVVITGSMIPITGFAASDAGFNLGFVIGSFGRLEPGVYISMNGGIFHAQEVEKNIELFRFE